MKLIFCAGISVRTGTNYMGSIMAEIPGVASIPTTYSKGEFPFFRDTTIRHFEGWVTSFNSGMFVDHLLKSNEWSENFGSAFLEYLEKKYYVKEDTIFVKDPGLYNVERFFDFFPDGKLILLTRNAADLIASSLTSSLKVRKSQPLLKKIKAYIKYYSGYSMYTYAKAYREHTQQLLLLRKKLKGQFLEVKYEDLVVHPEEKIAEILTYCDVPYTDAILEKAANAKVVGSSYYGAKQNSQNWSAMKDDGSFNPLGRYEKWGWFNKWIYRRFAAASDKEIGYERTI